MAGKVTQVEMERRVNIVYEMLLNGSSRHAIVQYCSKTWGITPRHGDNLIAKANAIFAEQAAFIRDEELGKSLGRLTSLYMRTILDKDYRGALAVQKELNAMLGLNAPGKLDIIDHRMLAEVVAAIEKLGQTPGDVFGEIIRLAHNQRVTQDVDSE